MISDTNPSPEISKEIIIISALKLLQNMKWANLEMSRLAKEVGISARDLYYYIPDKIELLKNIIDHVDLMMIKSYEMVQQPTSTNSHDQLFDIIMCRLEVMQPDKKAFQNLTLALWTTPFQSLQTLPEIFGSLNKILKMASIATGGILGMVKIKAFAIIYAIILKEWLKEENSEPSDMMIEIDKLLKQIAPILRTN
ncbi:MAG: TetR/AcrR family transcriptional regulator [Janthinobacterium lividum]